MTRTLIRWSFIGGIAVAALLLLLALTAPKAFTPDLAVQRALFWALLVLLVAHPLVGYVFALVGVFMGAGDARYLGLAGVVTMVAYVPVAAGLWIWPTAAPFPPTGSSRSQPSGAYLPPVPRHLRPHPLLAVTNE